MHKVICAMAMACFGLPAAAATVSLSGEIDFIDSDFTPAAGIEIGSTFDIEILLDDAPALLGEIPVGASFTRFYAVEQFSISFENGFTETIVSNSLTFFDANPIALAGDSESGSDVIGAFALSNALSSVQGLFGVGAENAAGTAFDADASLLEALQALVGPSAGDFDSFFAFSQFQGPSVLGDCAPPADECTVLGTITQASLTIAPIPLPASSVLLLAGLGGLAALRKRR